MLIVACSMQIISVQHMSWSLALYSISAKSNAPNSQEIILMGIAQSQAVLHTLISSVHVFSEVINLKSPNKDAR